MTVKQEMTYYNNHKGWKIVTDKLGHVNHSTKSVVTGRDDAVDAIEAAIDGVKPGYTCSGKAISLDNNLVEEDVPNQRSLYTSQKEDAKSKFSLVVNEVASLEKQLTQCDRFFEPDGEGLTEEALAKYYNTADINLKFSYEQIYKNEQGVATLDRIYVGFDGRFNGKACKVSAYNLNHPEDALVPNDNDIFEDNYSTKYGKGTADSNSFGTDDISLQETTEGVEQYLRNSNPYIAEKKFTTDGAYTAVCNWVEDNEVYYTLSPGGLVLTGSEVKTEDLTNYTVHPRNPDDPIRRYIYLNTYEGTFGTYWELSGIGHGGRLDEVFLDGTMCTYEPAANFNKNHLNADVPFSCYIKNKDKLVEIGYCTPEEGGLVSFNTNDCCKGDECGNEIRFQFKLVSPDDLFPNGTTTENGEEYAKNWTETEEGQAVMTKLQNGAEDVFAPSNITYSVVLVGTDIKTLKKYNESVVGQGGYKDFDLKCSCSENHGATPCTECKSEFISNLYIGQIKINNNIVELKSVGTSPNDLIVIRNTNNWKVVPQEEEGE